MLILTVSKSMLVEISDLFKSDLRLDMYRSPITVRNVTEIAGDSVSFDVIGKEGKISLKARGQFCQNIYSRVVNIPRHQVINVNKLPKRD